VICLATFLYALVGGPETGKTSIIEALKANEELTVREVATDFILERKEAGVSEPWFEQDFQLNILKRHIGREEEAVAQAERLSKGRVFLDRSMVDGYVYKTFHGNTEDEEFQAIDQIIKRFDLNKHYKAIFLVTPHNGSDFVCTQDVVRHENTDESLRLTALTSEIYQKHCPLIIEVPSNMTPEERAQFVLECVNDIEKS